MSLLVILISTGCLYFILYSSITFDMLYPYGFCQVIKKSEKNLEVGRWVKPQLFFSAVHVSVKNKKWMGGG